MTSPQILRKKLSTFEKLVRARDWPGIKERLEMMAKTRTAPSPSPSAAPISRSTFDAKLELSERAERELSAFIAADGVLHLRTSSVPKVAIVLVLFNKAELTYLCLKSLAACLHDELAAQVIIIDNASSDATANLLKRIHGAQIVSNPENVGFVHACNQALPLVAAELLLMLNNDTVMVPGCLERTMTTLRESDDIGAVGVKLVLPDGRVQEAGGIMWADGTNWGYARGAATDAPEVMFKRDVDYVSGAYLLTRTALFREAGGFDRDLAPAYYEDTDYCAWLQSRGLRIVYEPRGTLFHFEFGSSQGSSLAVELMQRNRLKYLAKHRELLGEKEAPGTEHLLARHRQKAPRILLIEDRSPHPFLGAGFPRAHRVVKAMLAFGAHVTLMPTLVPNEEWASIYQDLPREVEVLRGTGLAQMREVLSDRARAIDLLWVARPHNLKALVETCGDLLPSRRFKIVYDAEAIFSSRELLHAQVLGLSTVGPEESATSEFGLAAHADFIVSVSKGEATEWRAKLGVPVMDVGFDYNVTPSEKPWSERVGFIFIGALHGDSSPNADSMHWFLRNVMPRLRAALGERAKVSIVGLVSDDAAASFAQYGDAVEVVGQVPEFRPWLDRARVMLVPTRFASGIPLKVFDGTAAGVPIACSDLITKQMAWTSGTECLSASVSDPDAFAAQCIRLHEDEALWIHIRDSALAFMTAHYGPDTVATGVASVLKQVLV